MMFGPGMSAAIYLCTKAVDMRKSFDGLSGVVSQQMGRDPASGDYFVFLNQKRDRLKILLFDRHGYWVLAKRLEEGRFNLTLDTAAVSSGQMVLPREELMCIIEGIDLRSIRRFRRYALPSRTLETEAKKNDVI
jgi:transposase